eukprot:7575248-Lingulodinium_polyedra.AAC.1
MHVQLDASPGAKLHDPVCVFVPMHMPGSALCGACHAGARACAERFPTFVAAPRQAAKLSESAK